MREAKYKGAHTGKRSPKSKLNLVGRFLLLAVISLVIGVRLYSWNARVVAGNTMPMPFGWGLSVVLSGSMEPTLSVNDLVIVHEQIDYQVGDIVVYQNGNTFVLHRIVDLDDGTVITQGDANNTPDPPIRLADIKGKAVAQAPGVGAAGLFLKTPAGSLLVIIVAVLLLEVPYGRQRRKAETERERIKEEIRKLKDE